MSTDKSTPHHKLSFSYVTRIMRLSAAKNNKKIDGLTMCVRTWQTEAKARRCRKSCWVEGKNPFCGSL